MGVKGLTFYIKQRCPEACPTVSIEEMAVEHKRQFGGRPCIVVDGMSVLRKVYGDLEWLFGGQWRMYVIQMQDFVRAFNAKGIELIFFFDGAIVSGKRDEWVQRRLRGVRDTASVFEYIKASHQVPENTFGMLPGGTGAITRYIVKFMCHCITYTTTMEADHEIAEFARNNRNCFAILSQDSDFLIYDTKYYISSESLDLQSLTTVLFDRDALIRHLGLPLYKMPLFSCLMGNDNIPVATLKTFHKRLCASNRLSCLQSIPAVAKEILRRGWVGNPEDVKEMKDIVCTAVGNEKMIPRFIEALRGYMLVYPWNASTGRYIARVPVSSGQVHVPVPLMTRAYERHTRCENMSFVLALLSTQECEGGDTLEDGTDEELPACDDLLRPIRQRIYCTLFGHLAPCFRVAQQDSSGRVWRGIIPDVSVAEWFATPHNPLTSPEIVEALPLDLPDELPSLDFLWSEDRSVRATRKRLEVFVAIAGVNIPVDSLYAIPANFVLPCCMLNYVLRSGVILREWELAAFIAQMVCPMATDVDDTEKLQITFVEPRAVHLASMFVRGTVLLMLALCVCGHPIPLDQVMLWWFFDGKLFHHLYLLAKRGAPVEILCGRNKECVEEYKRLWHVATLNTSFSR